MDNEATEDTLVSILNRLTAIETKVDNLTSVMDNLTSTTGDILGDEYMDGIKDFLGDLTSSVSTDSPDLMTMVDSFKELRSRLGSLSEQLAETTPPMYRETDEVLGDE